MAQSDARPVQIVGDAATALERVQLGGGHGEYDEAWLQRVIHRHPECLPIGEIEPGFGNLVPVCMEMPTAHGPVDNLFVTAEGNIALVEVKLWRNPEARRKAVAQALDYSASLFELDYEGLENAALRGNFDAELPPKRLIDLFADRPDFDEAPFIDAVNRNLRRGRILVLVVGDGIRTEAHRLADLLQSHAGTHFTFALVELAIYAIPGQSPSLLIPRPILKTETVLRGIVEAKSDTKIVVTLPQKESLTATGSKPASITEEQFFEAMAALDPSLPNKLRRFLANLQQFGIEPVYRRALNLMWESRDGPVNLGYIQRNGEVWTSEVHRVVPVELSRDYIVKLGAALETSVERNALNGRWYVGKGNRAPRINEIADKLDNWAAVAERFVGSVLQRQSE